MVEAVDSTKDVGRFSLSATLSRVGVIETGAHAAGLSRWDRAGILVSGACAIHCTLLPLLIVALPVVGLGRLFDDRIEWAFVVTTALVGATAHARAYMRDHRHVAPGLIFAAGFSLVLCARLFLEEHQLGAYTIGVGGILAAGSHYANLRICRCCRVCAPGES